MIRYKYKSFTIIIHGKHYSSIGWSIQDQSEQDHLITQNNINNNNNSNRKKKNINFMIEKVDI